MEIWKEGAKKNHQHSRGTLNLNKKEKTASLFCNAEYRQENWKKLAEKKNIYIILSLQLCFTERKIILPHADL